MDPLSDVLSLLRPRDYMFRALDAGGQWFIRFPAVHGLNCYCLSTGECWLSVDGVAEAVRLSQGDCVFLPGKRSFCFFSDAAATVIAAESLVKSAGKGQTVTLNQGGECFGIGGYYSFAADPNDLLFKRLPPIMRIDNENDKAEVRWCIERMIREVRGGLPGQSLIAKDIAQILLVQALRLNLSKEGSVSSSWLYALGDRHVASALAAMHEDPGRRWTLETLAGHVGMSRSAFALKFKKMVGSSAIEYLTLWRMLLAGDRLLSSSDTVFAIAPSLGYDSESAFSTAFKKVMRCSPRQYRSNNSNQGLR